MSKKPSIRLRPLQVEDFEAIVSLQERCFPHMEAWTLDEFKSQLRHFPQGQQGIEIDGKLVATSAALVVDYTEYDDWHDWQELSDSGYIRNHDPEGDTLYGIEIQVDPAYRGMKLARRLYDARKTLCREMNLEQMIVGGRIPGYAEVRDQMSAEEYVQRVQERKQYDPVLSTQISNGFEVKEVVADYLPSDEDSAGHATILVWHNHDYVSARRARHRRPVFPVRVGVVQYPMRRIASFDEFATQIEYFVDTASDYRCDFLVFPELISVQLLCIVPPGPPPQQARALAAMADDYKATFKRLAMKYNVNIIGGSTFEMVDDDLYNIAYLFRRDGTYESQPKIHITPAEERWWGVKGGTELKPIDTDRGRVGIQICYDVEFPELARVHSAMGARMIFVPFNTNDRQGYMRVRTCAHARCIENHQYVVIAGCVGHLPAVENADLHYAQSAVLTPCDIAFPANGVAAQAAPAIEEMVIQDLDLEQLRRHRSQGTVRNWDDRRSDLYQVQWFPTDRDV